MYPKVYEIHITDPNPAPPLMGGAGLGSVIFSISWHYKLDTLIQKPNNYGKEIERPEKR